MKRRSARLAMLAVAALLGLGLAASVPSAQALPVVQRYVNITVTPSTLDLGTVPQPGAYDSPSILNVRVSANCITGGVAVAMTPLTLAGGGSIGPERIFVKQPATGNFVAMTSPVAVFGPMYPGSFNVVLKFRLQTTMADAPGQYTGTMTVTVAPPP